jgi:phage gpG-like protein
MGEIRQKVLIGAMKGMIAWGALVAQSASFKAPVDTGRLARSIHVGEPVAVTETFVTIVVGTNVEYARAHEFGSGIHAEDPSERQLILIEAKHKKALAFKWKNGPTDISAYNEKSGMWFFRRIWHPGVPAHPYLRPAAKENMDTGRRLVFASIMVQLRTS